MKSKQSLSDYLNQDLLKQLRQQREARRHNRLERLPDNQLATLGLKPKRAVTYPLSQTDIASLMAARGNR